MKCERCQNPAQHKLLIQPSAKAPRGRVEYVCGLCRPLVMGVAKERTL